ncbi:dihydroorotate dehydrogenase [Pseudopedobacter saltans DSM 12145]|uniref:Dihydroorotate dehydrogenase (quinone) n=1 Tax=Pseudopedobacter saltans (strain ATCC 51119 / DSM 12145 / JCM 21818 / CCUG 39354 / LMG 10337 / NBRC 100064 / NCIMB 13643) TaxID=762903 RepID=F0S5A5_PSESL|nr:quinone-dependent dihydroorotate dehydrogenase [Pseudopedobacter saltans]ADY52050.1 dihydroorotate dehydrogenase [Pseudopedobacter saltans DSM 12145]
MYQFLKPIFFQFDPEKIHHFVTGTLQTVQKIWGLPKVIKGSFKYEHPSLEREVFGLKFKNPVGLAAGFDKNGEYIEELANFGFGFIEVGTVTPLPQPGNDKPRMFRLPKDEALINRMGFNNKGVDVLARKLESVKREGLIIGGNIGKNKNTPNEEAVSDYIKCFDRLFNVVDYFVVNVSSPNTPNLRALQEKEPLKNILNTLQERNNKDGISKPILLKIAPDLTDSQLDDIVEIVQETKIAGVIATNTTISRENLNSPEYLKNETGGLSGKPVKDRSTEVIRYLSEKSNKAFPIIGVGGIHSAKDAKEKLDAGAALVQIYTGFIYEGPALIKRINKSLKR